MFERQPYYTFWEVVEKWAAETKDTVMDTIKTMRSAATYPELPLATTSPELPPPPLLIWPIDYLSAKGEISRKSAFNASKMVKVIDGDGKVSFQSRLYNSPEYRAAVEFLNSAKCPHYPTEEVKTHLSNFGIRREDFQNWCIQEGFTLPKFWFNLDEEKEESQQDKVKMVEEYISSSRVDHVAEEIIAFKLYTELGLTYLNVARVLALGEGLNQLQVEALKQRGCRLVNKGKEMVAKVEKTAKT